MCVCVGGGGGGGTGNKTLCTNVHILIHVPVQLDLAESYWQVLLAGLVAILLLDYSSSAKGLQ